MQISGYEDQATNRRLARSRPSKYRNSGESTAYVGLDPDESTLASSPPMASVACRTGSSAR